MKSIKMTSVRGYILTAVAFVFFSLAILVGNAKAQTSTNFPNSIGDFVLSASVRTNPSQCLNVEEAADLKELGLTGQICFSGSQAEYRNSSNEVMVNFVQVSTGFDLYKSIVAKLSKSENLGSYSVFRVEDHEIGWFPVSGVVSAIVTQEGSLNSSTLGTSYSYGHATGDNAVTKYFISKFSPTPPTTSTPTTSVCYNFTRNLQTGSTGADVVALQSFLMGQMSLGLIPQSPVTRGQYDRFTVAALVNYQKMVGLPAYGYFGPLTRAKVNGACTNPTTTTTPTTPPTTVLSSPYIYSITPTFSAGTPVNVSGVNFNSTSGASQIYVDGKPAYFSYSSSNEGTSISFGAPDSISKGSHTFQYVNSKGKSNVVNFCMETCVTQTYPVAREIPSTNSSDVRATDASLSFSVDWNSKEDRAGRWGAFGPGTGATGYAEDWAYDVNLTLGSQKTIKYVTLETPYFGLSGSSSAAPLCGNTCYPIVVFKDGQQLNHAYDDLLGTYSSGNYKFRLYAQKEEDLDYDYLRITFYFTDGTYIDGKSAGRRGGSVITDTCGPGLMYVGSSCVSVYPTPVDQIPPIVIPPTPVVVPTITVAYPNGGDTIAAGRPIMVTWTNSSLPPSSSVSSIKVDIVKGGSVVYSNYVANTGYTSITLTTPVGYVAGTNYSARVSYLPAGPGTAVVASDESDRNFTITPPTSPAVYPSSTVNPSSVVLPRTTSQSNVGADQVANVFEAVANFFDAVFSK